MKMKKPLLLLSLIVLTCLFLAGCGQSFADYRPITDADDLEGRKVGVVVGWSSDYILTPRKDINLYRYDDNASMLMALCYKKIDAACMDAITARMSLAKTTGLGLFKDPVAEEGYMTLFSNKDPQLYEDFNAWLAEYKTTPEYAEWAERYRNFDGTNCDSKIPEVTGTGRKLECLYVPEYFPMAYVDANGNIGGYDIEFVTKFANDMNYELVLSETASDAMAGTMMRQGKGDMYIGWLSSLWREEYEEYGSLCGDDYITLPINLIEIKDPDNLAIGGLAEDSDEE